MPGRWSRIHVGLILLLIVPAAKAEDAKPPLGQLGKYLPGDVWLYNCVVHTPSRDFLAPHWDRVFTALKSCGFEQEFKRIIASELKDEEKESFEKSWQTVTDLIQGVRWSDLIEHEIVIGERFGGLMPDIMLLCRPAAATRDQNVAGLARILEALASLDTKGKVSFRELSTDGIRTWALEVKDAPISLYLLHRADIVAIIVGRNALTDVCALLTQSPDAPMPIIATPRFRKAMANVPAPEFMFSYIDTNRLFGAMERLPEMMFGQKEADVEFASVGKKVVRSIIGHINFLDYGVLTGRMDGRREVTTSYFKVRPDCKSSCLYRMLVDRKPVAGFHRYVPLDAQGFAASSFINLSVLYETILDTIRTTLPDGQQICNDWKAMQIEWDFDLQEDFLSWFSGELVNVTLPSRVPSSFGSGEGVALFRVTDAAKATAKLNAGLARMQTFLTERGQAVMVSDSPNIPEGKFKTLMHPMFAAFMFQPCIGVWNDWLVIGSSESAVIKVMETASGKRKSILHNARFQREGIKPKGPVTAASFTDLSNFGEQMTGLFVGVGFFGAMIPDEPEARPIKAVVSAIGRLSPVFAEIDFFSSKASQTTFSDGAWRSTTLITYKPDKPKKAD